MQAFVSLPGHPGSVSRGNSRAVVPKAEMAVPANLLIVGPGRLGSRIAKLWTHGEVTGETRTETNHEMLRAGGIKPSTKAKRSKVGYNYVAITAPPTGNADYAKEVADACLAWTGEGAMVFTSATSVYGDAAFEIVNEDTPTIDSGTEKQQRLLKAEASVIEAGGTVLRLAGLYDRRVGPHNYWLRSPEIKGNPDTLINMIHYNDAASLALAILEAGKDKTRGKFFLGVDDQPLTRREICEAALQDPIYADKTIPPFTGLDEPAGKKRLDNSQTRTALNWMPQNSSMQEYFASQA
ncbi:hypothetical protein NDN08_000141 [Rhodosorus marinus]|uniref:NAD(P)-binding domain-containing protein n=1 Tax=Rhodosorus marinus TaxID=101924 RepID=A0AAV8UHP1_9RHOD|nr:hypothetical protein NDN08_000141 [Rhodosorus marinus]